MFDITLRRLLVSLAVVAGLVVAAGPAAADQVVGQRGIAGDGLQVPDVVAPQTDPRASGFTPPIGTDKGSVTPRSTP